MKSGWSFRVALVLGLLLGVYATTPPTPQAATAAATEFSAGRAMAGPGDRRPPASRWQR